VMLLTDSHAIREVVLFPLLRRETDGSQEDAEGGADAAPKPADGAKK
jgi:aspartyl-tRNA synthetase